MSVIFHVDLDSFFVSAERLRDPNLVGKCMAVGGRGPRSVISSASYEARKFGVRSAMPSAQALRICPQLILVPPHFDLYSSLSKRVFEVVRSFTPIFEQMGIDEGYLDMTGTSSLFGSPREAAERLRAEVRKKTQLAISVGIAANRLVAKVATDVGKPDGICEVPMGKEAEFLAPMPVRVLPGCGKVTEAWLLQRGLRTIRELQCFSLSTLERHLGKMGTYLHESAWGRGSTDFHEEAKTHTISREVTFEQDLTSAEELKAHLWKICTSLGRELRSEDQFAKAVRIKLRLPDFETRTRSRVLETPTQQDEALYREIESLFDDHFEKGMALRLLGAACVLGDGVRQFDLFADAREEERLEKLGHLKDELRTRFGEHALGTGRDFGGPHGKRNSRKDRKR